MPDLPPDEKVHREIIKAMGPLKNFRSQAKKIYKKMTKLNHKHKSQEFKTKKSHKRVAGKYKQFMKHKDNINSMFNYPGYQPPDMSRLFLRHDHAERKKGIRFHFRGSFDK